MATALIALKLTEKIPDIEADYIGADKGALILAKAGRRMRLAIGDFDSVNPEDLKLIREYADEMIVLNPIKDDSDSESALKHVLSLGYDRAVMTGSLGGRIDHELVNLRLVNSHPGVLVLMNEQNYIEAFTEGTYELEKMGYPYISFFTFSKAEITLENMKYPLTHRTVTWEDLYTVSNEIVKEKGILTVHSGTVLVIRSKDAE